MRHWRQTVLCCIINVELFYQVGGWTLGKAKDEGDCAAEMARLHVCHGIVVWCDVVWWVVVVVIRDNESTVNIL